MIDRIRPLKIENPVEGGAQTDYLPTEANPLQDYAALKGIAFNDDINFVLGHVGRTISLKEPYTTITITYLASGEVDYTEYFNSDTQITANRIYRTDLTYNLSLDPTQSVTSIYDVDGTTVLQTITFTYAYTSGDLTSSTVTIT